MPYKDAVAQREASAASAARRSQAWADHGLCRGCGKRPPAPNRAKCETCLQRHRDSQRRQRDGMRNMTMEERLLSVSERRVTRLSKESPGRKARTPKVAPAPAAPAQPKPKRTDRLDRLKEMAAAGRSGPEIAKELGYARSSVYNLARRHGIVLVSKAPAAAPPSPSKPQPRNRAVPVDRLRELAAEGKSGPQIAEEMGYAQGTIHSAASRHGIVLKAKPETPKIKPKPSGPPPPPQARRNLRRVKPCALCEPTDDGALFPQCARHKSRIREIVAGIRSNRAARQDAADEEARLAAATEPPPIDTTATA